MSSIDADLAFVRQDFDSWSSWFDKQKSIHESTGVPYEDLRPPVRLVRKLGPMPTPPWA